MATEYSTQCGTTSWRDSILGWTRWRPQDSTFSPFRVNLDLVGLLILANIKSIQIRTVITGTSSFWDVFVLCPGIHLQQSANDLNNGEYPAVAAMTTGYVFRVENSAVVWWLKKVGRPGELTNVLVEQVDKTKNISLERLFYVSAVLSTIFTLTAVAVVGDTWGLIVLAVFISTRLVNMVVMKRRCVTGWKGASEPSVEGDLLVLLSQDRWIRMQGFVDDLKAVTSGQWLRDMTPIEEFFIGTAMFLVYLNIALVANMSTVGQALLVANVTVSTIFLGLANSRAVSLSMNNRSLRLNGPRRKYERRLAMAQELIEVHGRDDWARKMGMIVDAIGSKPEQGTGEVIM